MLEYRIDPAARRTMITGSGRLSAADFRDIQARLGADPGFDPGFPLLSDYRTVTGFDLTDAEVREIAVRSPFDPGTRRALVMPNLVAFGMGRMFAIYSDLAKRSNSVRIFNNDIEAARRWLEGDSPDD